MNDQPPINTFSFHYRNKFGEAVGKIPLDTGQPCPNRDKGGCIFCYPGSFTPTYLENTDPIEIQLEKGKKHLLRDRFRLYFGYFQQETSTALQPSRLLPMIEGVLADTDCVGVIISTRPDCLGQELLEDIATLAQKTQKEILIEIGLQSYHEQSLKLLNRNHSVADFVDAVERIQSMRVIQIGVHLILGIPGESEQDMFSSVQKVCRTGVNAIKFHHLQVIRDTPLHSIHKEKPIPVFTMEAYMELLLKILPQIPPDIVIHRLWSVSHPDLLIAPRWNKFAGNLSARLTDTLKSKGLFQGCCT